MVLGRFISGAASVLCAPGALLEKKVDMDKRGLGVTDYNGMVTKALGCRPPTSKESSVDRPTFLDKVWIEGVLPAWYCTCVLNGSQTRHSLGCNI